MSRYSVLLELELQCVTHDKLHENVEKISSKCSEVLNIDVKPYGYYKYPLNPMQTTLD